MLCLLVMKVLSSFDSRLPEILRTFDHPSELLLSHLLDEIDCFKSEGENYWFLKVL